MEDEEGEKSTIPATEKQSTAAGAQAGLPDDLLLLLTGDPPPLPSQSTASAPSTDQEDLQLTELMEGVITAGNKVSAAVLELQADPASPGGASSSLHPPAHGDSYIEAMRLLQFGRWCSSAASCLFHPPPLPPPLPLPPDTFPFVEETDGNHVHFKVPFHYASRLEGVSSSSSPARARRLAQEVASLASSLPLTPNSSVFVRCDENRLDVMKVSVSLWIVASLGNSTLFSDTILFIIIHHSHSVGLRRVCVVM